MSVDPSPKRQNSDSLLAKDEKEKLNWEGILKESDDDEYPASFIATDQRLIFSLGSGHFKDIGLNHIESVEVAADENANVEGTDPDGIIGAGMVSAVVGIGAMIVGGALPTLVGLILVALGGYAIWWAKKNYQKLKMN